MNLYFAKLFPLILLASCQNIEYKDQYLAKIESQLILPENRKISDYDRFYYKENGKLKGVFIETNKIRGISKWQKKEIFLLLLTGDVL